MTNWVSADLHLHTALSPCALQEMTPNNIVNMAKLLGLRVIAIADHQAADNGRVVASLAEQAGIVCVPAMEVQTKEEVHILCYFADWPSLAVFAAEIDGSLQPIPASARFGRQLLFDRDDRIAGEKGILLHQSSRMSLEEVCLRVAELGGCPVPAHIDRPAFGLIGQLGFLPHELPISTVEASMGSLVNKVTWGFDVRRYNLIYGSDAHCLADMVPLGHTRIRLREMSAQAVVEILKAKDSQSIKPFVLD